MDIKKLLEKTRRENRIKQANGTFNKFDGYNTRSLNKLFNEDIMHDPDGNALPESDRKFVLAALKNRD